MSFFREYLVFLRENRKLWLIPLLAVLILAGAFVMLAQGSAFAPFIYTLF